MCFLNVKVSYLCCPVDCINLSRQPICFVSLQCKRFYTQERICYFSYSVFFFFFFLQLGSQFCFEPRQIPSQIETTKIDNIRVIRIYNMLMPKGFCNDILPQKVSKKKTKTVEYIEKKKKEEEKKSVPIIFSKHNRWEK